MSRWRFQVEDGCAGTRPREQAFGVARFEAIGSAFDTGHLTKTAIAEEIGRKEAALRTDPKFPKISGRLLGGRWAPAISSAWKYEADQVSREASAGVLAFRRQLRGSRLHCRRLLGLTDCMPLAIAAAKGRSSAVALRQPCRQIGALQLASNTIWNLRWVPSEFNPADDASRGRCYPVTVEADLLKRVLVEEPVRSPNISDRTGLFRWVPSSARKWASALLEEGRAAKQLREERARRNYGPLAAPLLGRRMRIGKTGRTSVTT